MGVGELPQLSGPLDGYGFVAALPDEARTLCPRPPTPGAVAPFGAGRWLGVSGMGAARARDMARKLLSEGVCGLVSWGTCAGLAPGLSPGTLIIANRILSLDGESYPTSDWATVAAAGGFVARVQRGALLSVGHLVTTVEEKRRLYGQCGALGLDMESAAVAQVAAESKVPFLALRAIVDPAEAPLPSALLGAVDDWGRVRLLVLLSGLGLHFESWRELWHLARHFRSARRTLRAVARRLEGPFG